MDALKAEIAARKKRKAQADSPSSSPQPASSATASAAAAATGNEEREKRYVRRGEEEEEQRRRRELEEEREQEEKRRKRRKEGALRHKSRSRTPDSTTNASASSSASAAAAVPAAPTVAEEAAASAISSARKEAFNISPQEAVQRLRAKGQPIRLFAESDKERRLRLRALELIEERGQKVGQNDFMKALQGAESGIALEELERGSRRMDRGDKEADKNNNNKNPNEADANGHATDNDGDGRSADNERESRPGVGMNSLLDLNLIRTDIHKVYPIIYYTLKQLLTDWEAALSQRPADVKATTQGKLVAATQRQTAEYLKPLFKKLRQRVSLGLPSSQAVYVFG
ncbi:hypothetical protein L7F22_048722 [Adiantum nelumboides]|nr:hypothetical protein [Adiantum nelumboides]